MSKISEDSVTPYACMKFSSKARRFFINDRPLSLPYKEYSLLRYFYDHPGEVLSRTQILEDVWDRNALCVTNTVDVHVSKLRRKLSPFFIDRCIQTVHCSGYLFDPSCFRLVD